MIWKLHPKTAFVFLFCTFGDFGDIFQMCVEDVILN